ncbi:glycosyltransferase family 2 protein [Candidatus Pelagibacter communis]|uniref:glycosyltransferase family 2 protein n=1 Tax=Pelagibacter ubique TaxID=198252 RepID=UPI000B2C5763|nr:hypothetical protein [Candidatus Pelagibacter ubique]
MADINDNKNSISIIIPSNQPETWERVINSYRSKKVDIEILFIGPKNCKSKLPENVRFINSNFKVSQCLEIGLKYSKNYYIFQSADDAFLEGSEDPLLDMIIFANSNPQNLTCLNYSINGEKVSSNEMNLISNNPKTKVPVAGLISREMIKKVGSYNKKYIGSYADVDLYLRINNAGYKFLWSNITLNEFREKVSNKMLSFRFLGHDIKYLKHNWVKFDSINNEYSIRDESLEKFEAFDLSSIEKLEQGSGTSFIFKLKLFVYLMNFGVFRYSVLIFYKLYRKFILRSKFY